jgi:Rod binding domain-containing protein
MNVEAPQRIVPASMSLPTLDQAQKAAGDFEGLFLRTIIKKFRESASTSGDGLFGDGPGSHIKESFFDDFMSEHIAANGGVGLAERLVEDWTDAGRIADAAPQPRAPMPSNNDIDRLMRQRLRGQGYEEQRVQQQFDIQSQPLETHIRERQVETRVRSLGAQS